MILEVRGDDARSLGTYYTPPAAARMMAEWVVQDDGCRVLEPSMGDGVFVRAVEDTCASRGYDDVALWGVEYAEQAYESVLRAGLVDPARAIRSDFLAVAPFEVDGVIGNPPYVRLRHLPRSEAALARDVAAEVLGREMEPSGSVWMPFVLHASRFLRRGGRLAMVLPYDFTYVRYARPLWRFLGSRFASLRVVRVRERIFPDILQEVVLLFADDFGGRTPVVEFDAYESGLDFETGRHGHRADLAIRAIEEGDRPFTEALLAPELRELLHARLDALTVELRDLAQFNIGYVTGDKRFFHPTAAEIRDGRLPAGSLKPAITAARQVRGAGLYTSGLPHARRQWLFLPPRGPLTESEARYVAAGEEAGVDARYKCRVRSPWWIVPAVAKPDLLLSVFSEDPVMMVNDGAFEASNSLLCGYLRSGSDPIRLAASWYTPLTALQRELHVHALGGGVFVLVPNEVARVRVPWIRGHVAAAGLDRAVRRWDMAAAYRWGSEVVLRRQLGLSRAEVSLIEDGRHTLARWRKSASPG